MAASVNLVIYARCGFQLATEKVVAAIMIKFTLTFCFTYSTRNVFTCILQINTNKHSAYINTALPYVDI